MEKSYLLKSVNFSGNWPNQVPDFYFRSEIGDDFRKAIKNLCIGPAGALILSGTGGVGKTTLAVYTLRFCIANRLFDDDYGVIGNAIWLNVGNVSRAEDFDDQNFFELIGECLSNCGLIDDNTPPSPANLRSAIDKIPEKMLFVLDDVFHPGVLRCMAKLGRQVRVLALTRNGTRARYDIEKFKSTMYELEVMTQSETETMLTAFYGLDQKGLDKQRQIPRLAKACLGLPLIASIVNAAFRKLFSPQRIEDKYWALVRNFDEAAASQALVDKFGDSDEIQMALSKIMINSPDFESIELVERLFSLLLFPRGQSVRDVDLFILWKLECENDVKSELIEAIHGCLLSCNENGYFLHDLLHKALMEHAFHLYKFGNERDVKSKLINESLSMAGENSLLLAIHKKRPALIRLFLEYGNVTQLCELCVEYCQPLNVLASQITEGEYWPRVVRGGNETSDATELFCLLFETCLQNNFAIISENLLKLIAKTMLSGLKLYQNIFHVAIKLSCQKIITLLLESETTQAHCSCVDSDCNDALMISAKSNSSIGIMLSLAESELFSPNACNNNGETALYHCAGAGDSLTRAKIVTSIRSENVKVDLASKVTGETALHKAVAHGNLSFAKFLVEQFNADVNLPTKNSGANATDMALAIFNRIDCAKWLLTLPEATVSTNWFDDCLTTAQKSADEELMFLLLTKKFDCLSKEQGVSGGVVGFPGVGRRTEIYDSLANIETLRNIAKKYPETFTKHVAQYDEQGRTPLMEACFEDNEEVVSFLLEHMTTETINHRAMEGVSALMIASENNRAANVQLLLRYGAKVDILNDEGWTSLMTASDDGHFDIVNILLEAGANVNAQNNCGWSSLMLASQNGHLSVARVLIQHGADVESRKHGGDTALIVAAQNGQLEIVRLLLENGSCVDARRYDGVTALISACYNEHRSVAKLLIENGANVDASKTDGVTALKLACQSGCMDVAHLLLDHEANIDAQDDGGESCLLAASHAGHIDIVRLLVDRGANVDLVDKDRVSALSAAVQRGHFQVAKLLVQRGADINLQDNEGRTALITASQYGHTDIVQFLVKYGARLDLVKDDHVTALMVASFHGHLEIVKFLVENGADLTAKSDFALDALQFAEMQAHNDILGYLKNLAN